MLTAWRAVGHNSTVWGYVEFMPFARRCRPLLAALALTWGCNPKPPITQDVAAAKSAAKAVVVASPLVDSAAPVVVAAPPSAPSPQLSLEMTPSTKMVLAGKEGDMFVRVRVTGLPLATAKRTPINLVLVVDTSGSMEGTAIDRAREACATLVDSLTEGDALAIVSFGSQTQVIVPATRTTAESKALAKKAIERIKAEGTTDLAGGLQAGLAQARTFLATDGINRIVLVGDGVPNDARSVTSLADQAQQLHIPITTLGLGPDFDETLMSAIAQHSGGTFHFVENASGVAKVFEQELSKMQRLVARGTWVELTPGPGVVIDDVLGLVHSPAGRSVRFQIGEMSEGQVRDAIVHITVSGHHEGSKIELLDAVTHYTTASTEAELVARQFLGGAASADSKAVLAGHNPEVEHQTARVRVADEMVRAIALARAGDLKGARALLDSAAKVATQEGKRFEDADLSAKAKEAQSIKKTVASLVPVPAVRPSDMRSRPKNLDFAPAPSPAAALQVRSAHGEAMRTIQGD